MTIGGGCVALQPRTEGPQGPPAKNAGGTLSYSDGRQTRDGATPLISLLRGLCVEILSASWSDVLRMTGWSGGGSIANLRCAEDRRKAASAKDHYKSNGAEKSGPV
jgi:hypothetical protein